MSMMRIYALYARSKRILVFLVSSAVILATLSCVRLSYYLTTGRMVLIMNFTFIRYHYLVRRGLRRKLEEAVI